MEAKRHYLIICEGASECAYVQELNRFLNENGISLVFSVVDAGGGGFDQIRQCCRRHRVRPGSRAVVEAWRSAVAPRRHFVVPLTAEEYAPVFEAFVTKHEAELRFGMTYRKGDMPFALTREKLQNLMRNNSDNDFPRSDFARFLQREIGRNLE